MAGPFQHHEDSSSFGGNVTVNEGRSNENSFASGGDHFQHHFAAAPGAAFPSMASVPASRRVTEEDYPPVVPIDPVLCREWIYPVNKEVRQYQLIIAKNALLHNTLVVLPTGLGKTLIAAVVMYNYYRWFPHGKVVFMAPTKPLVAQQIEACHGIMGIPQEHTAELQGSVKPEDRKRLWGERRVFYCTPQSMANDLARGACDPSRVVCIVVDEAHKAKGNFAYVTVVRDIAAATKHFRVLALSATPGSDNTSIKEVIANLLVANLETRSEDDEELKKYRHARLEEVIQCKPTEDTSEVDRLLLDMLTPYAKRLGSAGLLYAHFDVASLTPFGVMKQRDDYRARGTNLPQGFSEAGVESDFGMLSSLAGLLEHARNYGHGTLLAKLEEFGRASSSAKKALLKTGPCVALVALLRANQAGGREGHPKLTKLIDILTEHFARNNCAGKSTRAIVFSHFRDSVQEIVGVLGSVDGITARYFIGQGSGSGKGNPGAGPDATTGNRGMTQKEQKQLVRDFFAGHFNVLVATCIAEEGLDIGEVDLIINFDTHKSPIRMIQRMGRTARKRSGRVITLVTPGEEKKLLSSLKSATAIQKSLRNKKIFPLYEHNPRMVRGTPVA